jgi:AraC-like DNA-binding protein
LLVFSHRIHSYGAQANLLALRVGKLGVECLAMENNNQNSNASEIVDLVDIIGEVNLTASFSGLVARSLATHGLNVENVFSDVGLAIPSVNNPIERISFEQFGALIDYITEKSGDPCIGVKIFAGIKAADLSALGFAISCSTTLIGVAERLQRFLPYLISAGHFDIVDEEEHILLVIAAPVSPLAQMKTFDRVLECFTAAIISIIREIRDVGGAGFSQVFLRRCSSPNVASYLEGFAQCEFIINAPFDGMRISRKSALELLPSANPEMAMLNDKLLTEHLNRIFKSNIIYRVEQLVVEGLGNGHFGKSDIAKELAMSERTLHQKLEEKGAAFSDIVTRIRRNLAMQYVKAGELRINQVAYKLGFASASNFSRSFKKWTGCSPKEFKEL